MRNENQHDVDDDAADDDDDHDDDAKEYIYSN